MAPAIRLDQESNVSGQAWPLNQLLASDENKLGTVRCHFYGAVAMLLEEITFPVCSRLDQAFTV